MTLFQFAVVASAVTLVFLVYTAARDLYGWWLRRRKWQRSIAKGEALDRLALNVGVERRPGETDARLRERVHAAARFSYRDRSEL